MNSLSMLQVLGKEPTTPRSKRRLNDERVPKRQLMKSMQLDRADHHRNVKCHDVQAGYQLDFLLRVVRSEPELASNRNEVFLQNFGWRQRPVTWPNAFSKSCIARSSLAGSDASSV